MSDECGINGHLLVATAILCRDENELGLVGDDLVQVVGGQHMPGRLGKAQVTMGHHLERSGQHHAGFGFDDRNVLGSRSHANSPSP